MHNQPLPIAVGAAILMIFLLIALVAYPAGMFGGILSQSPQVETEKGAYYLFGGGVALLALLTDGFYNTILR